MKTDWTTICTLDDIIPNTGVCALHQGKQVAIFRIRSNAEELIFALDNFDPFSKANVLSRGIVGTLDNQWVVASPIYKQHFNLETGACLEAPEVILKTWPVRLEGNAIQLGAAVAVAA